MIDFSSRSGVVASTRSLKKLHRVPDDFSQALFANYPAMKLGVVAGVDFYVDKLAKLAKKTIQEHPECKDWVLTAPPFIAAPAAANLLCWKLYAVLKEASLDSYRFTVVDLHYLTEAQNIEDGEDFKLRYEYSNNSVQDRIKERGRLKDDIGRHRNDFIGKGVLIINDIKVTGIQQEFLSKSFEAVEPTHLQWLYILELDVELGKQHPETEHQINSSKIQSLSDFSEIMRSSDTHYTARCLSRLFNYDVVYFQSLISVLDTIQLETIFTYVVGEKRFEGPYFREKFEMLKKVVSKAMIDYPQDKAAHIG